MRILIFNFEYPPLGGGGGVATAQLAAELTKHHTVHVITSAFEGLQKKETINGVHIHRVSVFGRRDVPTSSLLSLITFAPSALICGIRLIREHRFDVINAQFVIPSGLPAVLLARMFHIPFVVSFIGGDLYDPSKGISPHRYGMLRWMIRSISKQAIAKTAISQDTKTRAIELHGVGSTISVVPIGLVSSSVQSADRLVYGIPKDAFLCISIGRLVARKGYETLIEAWSNVPDSHLIIIGDGPLRQRLLQTIEKLGLVERVHVLGFVPEEQKHALLKASDLYVSAAQHEGFGIVFLEAMDAHLPIVAANDGGQKDFLEHGSNAILIPPHDSKKIAAAVRELVADTALRERMGTQNANDVQQYYISNTARQFEQVLINARNLYDKHSV